MHKAISQNPHNHIAAAARFVGHNFVHLFLLATQRRVCGLDSQLSESNLPRTHTVVRLRFKGKEAETPYPQSVVHQ
jgi:hypothetical protein